MSERRKWVEDLLGWWTTSTDAPQVRYVAGWHRLLVGGLLLTLGAALGAALIDTWPAVTTATAATATVAAATAAAQEPTTIQLAFGLWEPTVTGENVLFVLVIEASLIGSLVHVASSFAAHSAKRDLTVSYLWWYPMRFIVGTGLALLLYTALRGGLFSGDFTSQSDVNPYGIAAIAGLSGMFSKQATEKLAQLFEVAFAVQPSKGAPKIGALDPQQVTAGAADTQVKVTGTGFVGGASATADDTNVDVTDVSATELNILLPSALLTKPATIKIRVDNPDPTVGASAPADFLVVASPPAAAAQATEKVEPKARSRPVTPR